MSYKQVVITVNLKESLLSLSKDTLVIRTGKKSLKIDLNYALDVLIFDAAFLNEEIIESDNIHPLNKYPLLTISSRGSGGNTNLTIETGADCFLKYTKIKQKDNTDSILFAGSFATLNQQIPSTKEFSDQYCSTLSSYGVHCFNKSHKKGVWYLISNCRWSWDSICTNNPKIKSEHIISIVNAPKSKDHNVLAKKLLPNIPRYITEKYPCTLKYLLTSGVDSFALAYILQSILKLNIHYSKLIHSIGWLQHFQVQVFARLYHKQTGIMTGILDYNNKLVAARFSEWKKVWEPIVYLPGGKNLEKATLNCITDFRCKEGVDSSHSKFTENESCRIIFQGKAYSPAKLIVRGNGTSQYQCFNGSLQRDRPFILGNVRGAVRRFYYHPLMIKILFFIGQRIFKLADKDLLSRIVLVLSINSDRKQSKHERKRPSFALLFNSSNVSLKSYEEEIIWLVEQYITTCQRSIPNWKLTSNSAVDMVTLWKEFAIYQRQTSHASDIYDSNTRVSDVTINTKFGVLWHYKYMTLLDILTPKPFIYKIFREYSGKSFREIFNIAFKSLPENQKRDLDSNYYNLAKMLIAEIRIKLDKTKD